MNIIDPLYVHALNRPAHPAVEDRKRIVNYAELAALVDRAEAALKAKNIGLGDIVVVSLPDSTGHVVALFALAKLGAVSVSIDQRSAAPEMAKAIDGLAIKAAIVENSRSRFLNLVSIPLGAIVDDAVPQGAGVGTAPDAAFDADRPVMLSQSSGTTGEPKRLFVPHRRMADSLGRLIGILRLTGADRYLQVPYLRFWVGRRLAIATMTVGGTIVLNHGTTSEDYLRYFAERGITYVFFTPFHLRPLLALVTGDAPRWPTLKLTVAAAPLSAQERLLARRRLTPHLFEIYGANEAGELAFATPDDQDRYPDATGRLIPGIEAHITGQTGSRLPFGEVGQIGLRGPEFPREYFANAEATARHFKDGWFYPGDLAAMNEEGYVFLKGRTDDVINNAGAKYFPAEVEAVLISHPAVTDVAVIGGPDPKFGEVSVAYVVQSASLTPKELHEFCRGKIDMYKAPAWAFFLDELPRVATGKPDKKALKEMFGRYLKTRGR